MIYPLTETQINNIQKGDLISIPSQGYTKAFLAKGAISDDYLETIKHHTLVMEDGENLKLDELIPFIEHGKTEINIIKCGV